MPRPGKFRLWLRLGIYAGVVVYLICDLRFCAGPLSRRISKTDPNSPQAIAMATVGSIVARVGDYHIHRSQLERAVQERLWSEGRTAAEWSAPERKSIRDAALEDLIDHELLRTKVEENPFALKVGAEELDERVRRFNARFSSKAELDIAMASQGIASERDLRDRLGAHIQQEKYVESRIAPLIQVSEEDARKWFEDNRQDLTTPERVEARHIFLPTLERDADEAKQTLLNALASLTDGSRDFATLAREVSEDPLTKDAGGALGWMTRERLPADLAEPLFAMPLHQPGLVRSKLGWHLLEVTARKPAEPRSFEQARPEILSALEAVQRRKATAEFRVALRKFEAKNIEISRQRVEE